jgi:hypothetical protein
MRNDQTYTCVHCPRHRPQTYHFSKTYGSTSTMSEHLRDRHKIYDTATAPKIDPEGQYTIDSMFKKRKVSTTCTVFIYMFIY